MLFLTEGQEVKVGEYNAIADVLDLINNSIRFQGMKKIKNMCMHLHFLWLSEEWPREKASRCSHDMFMYCKQGIAYKHSTLFIHSLAHLNPDSLLHTDIATTRCRDWPLFSATLNCPLSAKLFTSLFFTPSVFACVDILCNLFDPPGYSLPLHPPILSPSSLPRPTYVLWHYHLKCLFPHPWPQWVEMCKMMPLRSIGTLTGEK